MGQSLLVFGEDHCNESFNPKSWSTYTHVTQVVVECQY